MPPETPDPIKDPARLAALASFGVVDTPPDADFDRLTRLAARLLRTPTAVVSLVAEDRQFFKSCVGLPEPWASRREAPLSHSFCRHVVETAGPLLVEDAREHPLIRDNPAVADLGMIAYLGVPLVAPDGSVLGSFAAIDREPRRWTAEDLENLHDVGGSVMTELRLRKELADQARLREEARGERDALHVMLSSIGDAVIATDAEGRIDFLNPVAEALTGWTAAEARGLHIEQVFRIINESTRRPVRQPVDKVLKEGVVQGLANHTILIARDGKERPIDDSAAPIRGADGELRGVILVFRDIAERRKAEIELKKSEERYRGLFESIDEGFCVIEMIYDDAGRPVDYRFLEVNPAFERHTGMVDAVGRRMREFIPDHEGHWFEMYGRVAETGEPVRFQNVAAGLGGLWFELYAFRVGGPDERRVAVLFAEVTDRLRAETELKAAYARSEAVARATNDAVWDWDMTTDEVVWNRAVETLFGYGRDEVGGDAAWWYEHIHPDDRERVVSGIHHVIDRRAASWRDEYRFRKADGGYAYVLDRGYAVYDEEGRTARMVGAMLDLTERRKAETELSDARERLEVALAAGAVATWVYDVVADRVFADGNLAAMFGVSPEDAAGGRLGGYIRAIHDDDRDRVVRAIGSSLASAETFESEYRLVQADGSIRWVIARGVVRRDAEGRPTSLPGAVVDVTALKKAELDLERSRAWLKTVADSIPAMVSFVDLDYRYGFVNKAYEEWTGKTFEEVEGRRIGEVFGEEEFSVRLPAFEAALRGEASRFEGPLRHRTLGVRDVDAIYTPYVDAGRVRGFFVLAQDDTERHAARREREEMLARERRRAAQLRNLAEFATRLTAADGVESVMRLVTEEARRLVGAGQAATTLYAEAGRPPLNVVSTPRDGTRTNNEALTRDTGILDLLEGRSRPLRLTQAELESAPRWAGSGRQTSERLAMNGWLGAPVVNRAGRRLGVIQLSDKQAGPFDEDDESILLQLAQMTATALDNAGLYEELNDKDRRKDEFLAMLAHELRNPLAAISSAVAVASRPEAADFIPGALEIVQRQSKNLSRLVADLLDVARISRGKVELRRETVDVAAAVGQAAQGVRPLMEQKGQEFALHVSPGPLRVDADPTRLEQVVGNLLTNAAKYTEPGGRIALSVAREGDEAVVRVEDSGVGISPQMLPRIFDLFTQVDSSLDRSEGGLGIGLTLVKRLVEMHGGTVAASSEAGRGSVFTVRLPAHEAEAPPIPVGPSRESAGGRRVLIVDDNIDSAQLMGAYLEMSGHEVRVSYDGGQGVEAALEFGPEVVVLDIGLPGLNGYEAARRLRADAATAGVLIVAVSGYADEASRAQGRAAGFDHHLAKPVDVEEIASLISQASPGKLPRG